jgi:hypothetical protein
LQQSGDFAASEPSDLAVANDITQMTVEESSDL